MPKLLKVLMVLAFLPPVAARAQYCLPGYSPCIPTSPYLPGGPEDPIVMQQNTNRQMEQVQRQLDEQKRQIEQLQRSQGRAPGCDPYSAFGCR